MKSRSPPPLKDGKPAHVTDSREARTSTSARVDMPESPNIISVEDVDSPVQATIAPTNAKRKHRDHELGSPIELHGKPRHKKQKSQPDIDNVCESIPGDELDERIQASLKYCTTRKVGGLTIISKKSGLPGEGPRNVALLMGIQKKHLYAYQFCTMNPFNPKTPCRGFGTAPSIEDACDALVAMPPQQRGLFEYLSLQGGTFLAADIEWYHPLQDASPTESFIQQLEDTTLKTLRQAIQMVLGSFKRGREQNTGNSRVITKTGHATKFIKISIHYKHTGVGFGPIVSQKGVWKEIIKQATVSQLPGFMSDHPQEDGKWLRNQSMVDMHLYKRAGEMRAPYSVKLPNTTPLTSREYPELTKVNFISHSIGIHDLKDREALFQASGLDRHEFDERLPLRHNIDFIDSSAWNAKEKVVRKTNKKETTPKQRSTGLLIDGLNETVVADTSNQSVLYQWILRQFKGTNEGFTIRTITRKDNTTVHVNLMRPANANFICSGGVEHDSNNLCVNLSLSETQGAYGASCFCYGCAKATKWGNAPANVIAELQLPAVSRRKNVVKKQAQEEKEYMARAHEAALGKLQRKYSDLQVSYENSSYFMIAHDKPYTCIHGNTHDHTDAKYARHVAYVNVAGQILEKCECCRHPAYSSLSTEADDMHAERGKLWEGFDVKAMTYAEDGNGIYRLRKPEIRDDEGRLLLFTLNNGKLGSGKTTQTMSLIQDYVDDVNAQEQAAKQYEIDVDEEKRRYAAEAEVHHPDPTLHFDETFDRKSFEQCKQRARGREIKRMVETHVQAYKAEAAKRYGLHKERLIKGEVRSVTVTARRQQANTALAALNSDKNGKTNWQAKKYNDQVIESEYEGTDTNEMTWIAEDQEIQPDSRNDRPEGVDFYENLRGAHQIVQFESLYKFGKYCINNKRDIFMVDEIRSILERMLSFKTNKDALAANINAFVQLCRGGGIKLGPDADLEADAMMATFFRGIFSPEELMRIRVERYPPVKDSTNQRKIYILHDENQWLNKIMRDINDGKKIMIVHTSISYGTQMVDYFDRMNANAAGSGVRIHYRWYNGKSGGVVMRDFLDVNTSWGPPVNVVMFNSAVTVGADCTVPMDNVYIMGKFRTCPARDSVQGAARARVVRGDFYVLLRRFKYRRPMFIAEYYERSQEELTAQCSMLTSLRDMETGNASIAANVALDSCKSRAPAWYSLCHAIHRMEQDEDYGRALVRLYEMKNAPVLFYCETEEEMASLTEIKLVDPATYVDKQEAWHEQMNLPLTANNKKHKIRKEKSFG